ncbi:MAG: nucleotide exchange factor GrpE [bacterium]|jgi:molecular chaperone GrpE|nr:nucleotide exchange factor GrpE [candidate division KSB1 bacterium]MDH7561080.1 nucleotide exchange factor GrpE [bacterium]
MRENDEQMVPSAEEARISVDAGAQGSGEEAREEIIPVQIVGGESEHPAEQKLAESAATYLDQLRRTQADFVNYKRRVERERADFAAAGRREVLRALLPVLDDFDNLLAYHGQEQGGAATGLRQVAEKLRRVLTDSGLQRFGEVGERFDPELHEAVATEPCSPELDGLLLEVWQPGYRVDGQVLRAAKVKVGRAGREGEL